jgi:hypothetical protein
MNKKVLAGLSALVFSALACEPIFVIGWKETFFVFILIAFLIGPPIYRFIRKFEKKDK